MCLWCGGLFGFNAVRAMADGHVWIDCVLAVGAVVSLLVFCSCCKEAARRMKGVEAPPQPSPEGRERRQDIKAKRLRRDDKGRRCRKPRKEPGWRPGKTGWRRGKTCGAQGMATAWRGFDSRRPTKLDQLK